MKLTCPHCDYTWECKSLLLNVTCPNCLLKVKVEKAYVGGNVE